MLEIELWPISKDISAPPGILKLIIILVLSGLGPNSHHSHGKMCFTFGSLFKIFALFPDELDIPAITGIRSSLGIAKISSDVSLLNLKRPCPPSSETLLPSKEVITIAFSSDIFCSFSECVKGPGMNCPG